MKQISHEVPLELLQSSVYFNDYDYALVHLLGDNPEYSQFFKDSLKAGRRVILDNSLFELGEAFSIEDFAYWIRELKPTEYIIPDVWEDTAGSIENLKKWDSVYSHIKGVKIGVVQGKNHEEMVESYKAIDKYCDKIAISFGYSHFLKAEGETKEESLMNGRIKFIDQLIFDGVANLNKPHHLLGAALPQEFIAYKHPIYNFIKTIDTSNPIVHGIKGIPYKMRGLNTKENIKLVDLFQTKLSSEQHNIIAKNIKRFRSFVNGL